MKILETAVLLLIPFLNSLGQENFVPGKVTLATGETLEGKVNDLYWKTTPSSIQFIRNEGTKTVFHPEDLTEFRISEKAIYKSRLVEYDSTGIKSEEITFDRNPRYKKKHIFLKVLVDARKTLLLYAIEKDHFFIQDGDKVYELINHPYRARVGENEARIDNKLYLGQLGGAFSDCPGTDVPNDLLFNAKTLSDIFLKYATCKGEQGRKYQKKDPSLVRKGFVGTMAYDEMKSGFTGGTGYGFGGYVAVYYPYKIYKYSLYTEFTYRKFGNQVWQGLDYAHLPYKETHQVQSMKLSAIARSRISRRAGPPYSGYTYIGIGFAGSFGLNDLYQRAPYTAHHGAPFFGAIFNTGIYLSKNMSFDFRYEIGSPIFYNDFVPDDDRPSKCNGYSSLQASILIEF